jgi:hypothetical protein
VVAGQLPALPFGTQKGYVAKTEKQKKNPIPVESHGWELLLELV